MEAIIYSRFSTIEQRKGTSAERQQRARDYATAQGWAIVRDIIDQGFSAWSNKHRVAGQLGLLEAEILAGEHDGRILVIEHLDRLSRLNSESTLALVQSIVRSGVSIITTSDGQIYERNRPLDLMTMMKLLIVSEQNHEQSEQKSRRLRDGYQIRREKARETGRVMTENGPGWLRLNQNRKFEVIEERAALVREIFSMAEAGLGKVSIARVLNERGEPAWKNRKTGWYASFIYRLLNNSATIGEFQPTRMVDGKRVKAGAAIKNYYPAIIDADLFARVCASADDRKAVRGRRSQNLVNIFSGLARCAHCDSNMMIRVRALAGTKRKIQGKEYTRTTDDSSLTCSKYYRKAGCDNSTSIGYSRFERVMMDEILHIALDDSDFEAADDIMQLRRMVAELERDFHQASEAARELWLAYARDTTKVLRMELAELEEARADDLRGKLEAAKADLMRARGKVSDAAHLARVADVRDGMNSDDPEIRYQARAKVAASLRSIVSFIDCDRDGYATVAIAGGLVAMRVKGKSVERVEAVGAITARSLGINERKFVEITRRLSKDNK